jgi:membrane protease YdiL (CAAX protease family)
MTSSRATDNWVAAVYAALFISLSMTFVSDLFVTTEFKAFWSNFLIRALLVVLALSYAPFRTTIWESLHIRNRRNEPKSVFALHIILYIVCGLLVSIYVIEFINSPMVELFPPTPEFSSSDMSVLYIMGEITLGITIVAIEEELFHRVIIGKLIRNYTSSLFFLYIVSAFIFGISHWPGGLSSISVTFLMGLMLMFLYHRTGSILPSIIVHYLHNFLATFFI